MVIQEAFAARVPVVASRIGALAEKVRDGIDGMLCEAGQVGFWCKSLLSIMEQASQVEGHRAVLPEPRTVERHADSLTELYAHYDKG